MIKKIIDLLCIIKDKAERILNNILDTIIPTLNSNTTKIDYIVTNIENLTNNQFVDAFGDTIVDDNED